MRATRLQNISPQGWCSGKYRVFIALKKDKQIQDELESHIKRQNFKQSSLFAEPPIGVELYRIWLHYSNNHYHQHLSPSKVVALPFWLFAVALFYPILHLLVYGCTVKLGPLLVGFLGLVRLIVQMFRDLRIAVSFPCFSLLPLISLSFPCSQIGPG